MFSILRLVKPVLVIVATALPAQAAPAYATTCFDDWSDAAPVMLKEKLVGTRELHEQARQHLPGDLVRITLCQEENRYIYRLLMRDPLGRLTAITVDARRPFDR
jgi:hypothetical protein